MIRKFRNTYVEKATEMLNVTDQDILEWSNGEVNCVSEKKFLSNSLGDSNIFGKLSNQELTMGHIALPVPIVNTHYLCGRQPVLAQILGMEQSIVENIVHYVDYINLNPKSVDYKKIISDKECCDLVYMPDYKSGAKAIEILLGNHEMKDYIILHNIPVIPICMRYMQDEKDPDFWYPMYIDHMYASIIYSAQRYQKLIQLNVPPVFLLEESKILQERVDAIIDNGAYGSPVLMGNGMMAESLSELYEYITKPTTLIHYNIPKEYISSTDVLEIVKQYQKYKTDELENQEENEIVDSFMKCIKPFLQSMLETYFVDYLEHKASFFCISRYYYSFVLPCLDLEKGIEEQTCEGLGKIFEFWVKKKINNRKDIMWENLQGTYCEEDA